MTLWVAARDSDARAVALIDNRPQLDRLKRMVAGAKLDPAIVDDVTLQEILDASIAWVQLHCTTAFNGRARTEIRDGNGTNGMNLLRRPATRVQLVTVSLPVLALTRTYTEQEIKLYSLQGYLSIFTFKLGVEQASLHLDQQVMGNIFPSLPQAVRIDYTFGFPQYDDVADVTQYGEGVVEPGDTRDPDLLDRLDMLQAAAVCDAAASVLGQLGGLGVGILQSVSFDGFSQGLNPQAFGPQVQALVERRDALMGPQRRRMILGTVS